MAESICSLIYRRLHSPLASSNFKKLMTEKARIPSHIIFTGMTETEGEKSLKHYLHNEIEGLPLVSPPKRCYLCKRTEGSKSLVLHFPRPAKQEVDMSLKPLPFKEVRTPANEKYVFVWHLCMECHLLLTFMASGQH